MALTPQQQAEIYPILDAILELPPGKGVLHKCTYSRASYLTRVIQGFIYDNALESILIYPPSDPAYGKGSYAYIWVEPHEQGLLGTRVVTQPTSFMWGIIHCAATHESVTFHGSTIGSVRQRLFRAQKKHPELLNPLWVDTCEVPTVHYGEVTVEGLAIVDIDLDPNAPLRPPTPKQQAQSAAAERLRKQNKNK